jgi:hypothetical protein
MFFHVVQHLRKNLFPPAEILARTGEKFPGMRWAVGAGGWVWAARGNCFPACATEFAHVGFVFPPALEIFRRWDFFSHTLELFSRILEVFVAELFTRISASPEGCRPVHRFGGV